MLIKIETNTTVYQADNTDIFAPDVLKQKYQALLSDIGKQTSRRKLDSYAKVTDYSFSLLIRGKIEQEKTILSSKEMISPGLIYKKTNASSDIKDYSVDELLAMAKTSKKGWTGMLLSSIRNHSCALKATCPSCNGSSQCGECHGDGTVICNCCYGKGECSCCKGTGEVECQKCDGSGSIRCFYCDGDGYVDCYNCDGDGYVDCWDCDGTGTYRKYNGEEVMCRKCQGTGRFECQSCDGTGTETCEKCHGYGTLRCRKCRGTGIVSCTSCKGTGDCSKCDGNGIVECNLCNGNGVCSQCEGNGEIECPTCKGTGNYQSFTHYQLKLENLSKSKSFDDNAIVNAFDEGIIGTKKIWEAEMIWEKKNGLQRGINLDELGSILVKTSHLGPIKEWVRQECVIPNEHARYEKKKARVLIYGIPLTEVHFMVGKKKYQFFILGNNNVLVIDDEKMPNKFVDFFRSLF